jgi:AraC family transcriptional regulator
VSVIHALSARHDLNLGEVASALGVSRCRLSRAFSGCGNDFRSCVRQARMLDAGDRLSRSDSIVKTVAFDVGYRHHSDFTRHFRAHWGMTPTAFRHASEVDRVRIDRHVRGAAQ